MNRSFSMLLATCAMIILAVSAAGTQGSTESAQVRADDAIAPLTWAWD
ncbi:hypothetical protein AB0D37_13390 [Streptomyces sp. NPDC048384]|jgi:hypothetical protein